MGEVYPSGIGADSQIEVALLKRAVDANVRQLL